MLAQLRRHPLNPGTAPVALSSPDGEPRPRLPALIGRRPLKPRAFRLQAHLACLQPERSELARPIALYANGPEGLLTQRRGAHGRSLPGQLALDEHGEGCHQRPRAQRRAVTRERYTAVAVEDSEPEERLSRGRGARFERVGLSGDDAVCRKIRSELRRRDVCDPAPALVGRAQRPLGAAHEGEEPAEERVHSSTSVRARSRGRGRIRRRRASRPSTRPPATADRRKHRAGQATSARHLVGPRQTESAHF